MVNVIVFVTLYYNKKKISKHKSNPKPKIGLPSSNAVGEAKFRVVLKFEFSMDVSVLAVPVSNNM